tara:strand:+ start:555 stop:800 length:246 start_codon:yes stop_codon:yes gene_type:complete
MHALKQRQLLPEHTTGTVTAAIVIPQDHRKWKGERTDALGQPQISITEVPNKQDSVGPKCLQQLLVLSPPCAMQVTSDRET